MPATEEAITKATTHDGSDIRIWNSFLQALSRLTLLGATIVVAGYALTASASENHVVQMDGAGAYVELPDGLGEDWEAATIELRVRWDGLSYYATPLLFGDTRSSIGFNQSEGLPSPRVYSQREGGRPNSIGIEERADLGVWIHLAATFETSQLRLWVNGRCLGTNTHAGPGLTLLKSAPSRWLGRSAWKENGYFRGRLDEVRLWNRILSDDELAHLPRAKVTGTEPGLYARWAMDAWTTEAAGTVCWSDGAERLPAVLRGGALEVVDHSTELATFEPAWWLEGTVRDPEGRPVVAELRWLTEDLDGWHVVSDTEGRFRWRGMRRRAPATVRATSGTLGVLGTVDLSPSGPIPFDLKLETAAAVQGNIVRWDGAPRPGVRIRIRPANPKSIPVGEGWTTRSDRLGRFAFPALPDGDYEIECDERPDAFSRSNEAAVSRQHLRVRRADGPTSVTLRVAAGSDGMFWRRFTRRDGLPDNALTALAVDTKGTLWIGTSAGLARYDGIRFGAWTRDSGPAGGAVTALAVDDRDQLWFASDRGLFRLKGNDGESVSVNSAKPGLFVFDMTRTSDGAMWLATDQGLHQYRDGKWRRFGAEDGLPGTFVQAVWPDETDSVRVWTEGLFARVSERGTQTLPLQWSLDRESHPFLSKQPRSGAASDEIERGKWKRPKFPLVRGDGTVASPELLDIPWSFEVRTILQVSDRETWVATHQHGLLHIARESTQSLTPTHGLPAGVKVSLRTRDGLLWIGTDGGLVRWNGAATTLYQEQNGLPGNSVSDLLETADGALWVSGNRGVARWTSGHFQPVPGSPFSAVPRLRVAPNGSVWALAAGLGLYTGDATGLKAVHADLLQPHVWSLDLLHSNDQNFLLATLSGVVRVHDGKVEPIFEGTKTIGSQPSALLESRDGSLWIGTTSTGLHRRDRLGQWRRFDLEDGLASRVVRTLHEDARGWIWVGTSDGVNLFREGLWGRIGELDGVAGLDIRHIRSEADGSVWFATDGGLTRYQPAETPPRAVWREDSRQGLDGSVGSAIGGSVGRPLHQSVEAATTHRLRWRVNEGDRTGAWSELRSSHEWTWAPTHPGKATIEAQVIDRDLNISETLRRSVHVATEWYRRREVIAAAAVAALAVAGVLTHLGITLRRQRRESARLREEARQLEAADLARMEFERRLIRTQEAERARIARELHDSLGQELLLIRNSALLARRGATATQADPALGDIADRASRTIEEVRAIAYALRPQELDRYGMATAMKGLCDDLSTAGTPTIEFQAEPPLPALGPEVEIGLFRILQECLTNALKHAGASKVHCRLAARASGAELQVTDDGRGFEPEAVATNEASGLGLNGMQERVRLLGGQFQVVSQPGHGTTVTVWIPAISTPANSG
ncbi:MAG: hypothetical protein IT581_09195 [Verrucomicrobiales bacterium]|nr:hypothetical protein [Verrucomicrobiales bacterium]